MMVHKLRLEGLRSRPRPTFTDQQEPHTMVGAARPPQPGERDTVKRRKITRRVIVRTCRRAAWNGAALHCRFWTHWCALRRDGHTPEPASEKPTHAHG